MTSREIPPLHEVAKLERKFKLLFFLRDLGIKSAKEPSVLVWERYMYIIAQLSVGG